MGAAPQITPSERVTEFRRTFARAEAEVGKVIVGHQDVIRKTLTALFAGGHVLIEGVPGLGKTLMCKSASDALGLSFKRIQFTPDLMPSDIVGTQVLSEADGRREFNFKPGPIFAHVVLGDEINRATPKTQSALLEAMEERQVTVDGESHALPAPFFVIATQNPHHQIGTFPLPESQLDRFLMRIKMGYPSVETEREILRKRVGTMGENLLDALEPVAEVGEVMAMQDAVAHIKVDSSLHDYALEIVNRTRTSEQLALGVSPRGTLMLQRAAQARAFLDGRDYCLPDDFKQLAVPVFSHRVVASSRHASLQKKSETTESVLRDIVESVPVPL
jgi:MoxR-like ATPase